MLPLSRQDHHNRTEATESDSKEYIYDPGDVEIDEEPTSDDAGLNYINQTPSTHLCVVKYVSSQLTEKTIREKVLSFTCSPKLEIEL